VDRIGFAQPPVSEPSAAATTPLATAADPDDEPPET
jgi:hypothetical protein